MIARDRQRPLGVLAVSAATFVWGLVPLVLKQTDMPALAFAMYRLWLGVLVYGVVLLVTRRRVSLATLRVCALGGVFFGIDISLAFTAFKLTSVANATIIGALSPVFITLAAARWFGERVERRDLLLVLVSFAGVAVVAVGSAGSPTFSLLGDLAAGLSTLSWTAYWLFSKRARGTVPALEYMACVMFVAALVVTVVAIPSGVSLAPPQGNDWVWIWLITLVPGATGHLLLAWSHRHVEAWLLALITQCQPVVGSIAAWLVLGESLTWATIVGGAMVLAATAVIIVRGARGERERPPELAPDDVETAVERPS